jgi:phage terminase small subunit
MNYKQTVFVTEYLKDFNATQAAIRAGYSENAARAISSKLLTKADIKSTIEHEIAERSMHPSEILVRFAEHARGDIGTFADDDGHITLKDKPTRLIKKLKTTRRTSKDGEDFITTEIELHDPQAALSQLSRMAGMFNDKTTNLTVDLSSLTDNQLKRLADGDDIYTVLATESASTS